MSEPLYDSDGKVRHEAIKLMMETVVNTTVTASFQEVKNKLGGIEEQLHGVIEALTGNGFGVHRGLIFRVQELERQLEAHQLSLRELRQEERDRWNKVKWMAIGWGMGAGLSGGGAFALLMKVMGG